MFIVAETVSYQISNSQSFMFVLSVQTWVRSMKNTATTTDSFMFHTAVKIHLEQKWICSRSWQEYSVEKSKFLQKLHYSWLLSIWSIDQVSHIVFLCFLCANVAFRYTAKIHYLVMSFKCVYLQMFCCCWVLISLYVVLQSVLSFIILVNTWYSGRTQLG